MESPEGASPETGAENEATPDADEDAPLTSPPGADPRATPAPADGVDTPPPPPESSDPLSPPAAPGSVTEPTWNPLPPKQPAEPKPWSATEPSDVGTPPHGEPLTTPPPSAPADPLIPPSPVGETYEPLSSAYPGSEEPKAFRPVFGSAEPTETRMPAAEAVLEPVAVEEPRRASRWQLAGIAIVAGLIGAGLALVGFLLLDDDSAPEPVANAEPVVIREQVRTEFIGGDEDIVTTDAAAVARKVVPSVVHVQIGIGAGTGFSPNGSGSGVVLSANGLIVTNNHVVEGADDVQVIFADGRIYDAIVIGTDPTTDLAVVEIEARGLIPIEIGSADDLGIGDVAIAAGNPLGLQGGPSVTVGVISAFNREVQTSADPNDQLYGMLQTDAPITRGSSGGALVDGEGKLIGITTAVGVSDVGVEGIGFAIPVELVQRITDELIENGSVDHAFLGISGSTNFESQPDGSTISNGITVQTFESDSAAATAGLAEGDVITAINGVAVSTIEGLIVELREYTVGQTVDVSVLRDGEEIILVVDLGSRAASLEES